MLDRLVRHAIRYYQDFVKPAKRYRAPTEVERAALEDLVRALEGLPKGADAETIQTQVYEVGKRHPFPELKAWFSALYEVLLGQPQGPRFGSFVALYGVGETMELVREALTRSQKSAGRGQ
jgi:lysyl-tRNA synthetase class 1